MEKVSLFLAHSVNLIHLFYFSDEVINAMPGGPGYPDGGPQQMGSRFPGGYPGGPHGDPRFGMDPHRFPGKKL